MISFKTMLIVLRYIARVRVRLHNKWLRSLKLEHNQILYHYLLKEMDYKTAYKKTKKYWEHFLNKPPLIKFHSKNTVNSSSVALF